MSNRYYKIITVSSDTYSVPELFSSQATSVKTVTSLVMYNQTGTANVFYSFDGVNDHGRLGPTGDATNVIAEDWIEEFQIFFRKENAADPNQDIEVKAWGRA